MGYCLVSLYEKAKMQYQPQSKPPPKSQCHQQNLLKELIEWWFSPSETQKTKNAESELKPSIDHKNSWTLEADFSTYLSNGTYLSKQYQIYLLVLTESWRQI